MKKFPFSKKAINIMIAAALVATPLATLAPVAGTSVVEASETLPGDTLLKLIELNGYYQSLSDIPGAKEVIDGHRMLLGDLEASDWSTILGSLESDIKDKLTTGTATEMMTELANVFLQTSFADVLSEVNNFHQKYQADFQAAFGISFVQFLGFYADLMDQVKTNYNKSTIEAAIGSSLTDFMVAEAKKVSSYQTLSAAVKAVIGPEYNVASLVNMKFALMDALSAKGSDVYAPGTLKDTLIAAVIHNLSAAPAPIIGTPSTPTLTIETALTRLNGVATVDTARLIQYLNSVSNVQVISISISAGAGQVAQAKIPTSAFDAIVAKNPNAILEIVSPEGTLRLPVGEINKAKLAPALGVTAGTDVMVTVSINKGNDTAKVIEQHKLNAVSNIVEFKVAAEAAGKAIDINRFGQYIERTINGSSNFNVAKSSVVRLNADGSFTAVPTVLNGNKATFKSFSNSNYVVVENTATFSDVKAGYWAKATIEKLGSKYIVEGKGNGKFDPLATTTRAEFATLLTRSLGLSTDASYNGQFSDVKGTEWFAKDLVAAVEAGIIKGHANGKFGYNDPVTREEAAVMITRALNLVKFDKSKLDTSVDVTKFQDASKVAPWAKSSVTTLVQLGVTEGRPNGFAPKAGTQRAEMAALLERFLVKVDFMN